MADKIKIEKDNVVLSIEKEDLAQYEARGYCELGGAKKKASSTNIDKKITTLEKEKEDLSNEIADLNNKISEKDNEIADLNNKISEKDNEIADYIAKSKEVENKANKKE